VKNDQRTKSRKCIGPVHGPFAFGLHILFSTFVNFTMLTQRFTVVVALLLVSLSTGEGDPCPCAFDREPEQEKDCKVYGQVGGSLIAWDRADHTCLDMYNISERAMETDVLYRMCPHPNETTVDVQAFMNYIRYTDGTVANNIKLAYPNFFKEDEGTNSVRFPDSITTQTGTVLNCTSTPSFCWDHVKIHFSVNQREIGVFCAEFHSRMKNELKLEQSLVRSRLCTESSAPDCEPLASRVREVVAANPNLNCEALGTGPGTAELPDAETCGVETPNSGAMRAAAGLVLIIGVLVNLV